MARPTLTYRKPQLGRDYWIKDGILPDPDAVAARCYGLTEWELGAPHRPEPWPGMRAVGALLPDELALVEAWVKQVTGAKRLWTEATPEGAFLNHNYAQLVGMAESGPRPHTDSRKLCRYAAVIYLTPRPEADAGTSFYRLRYPDGTLGAISAVRRTPTCARRSGSRACRRRRGRRTRGSKTASTACCCTAPIWCIRPAATSASSMPTSA